MILSDAEIGWAAGFFDGEGCVMIKHHRRGSYYLEIRVDQVDPPPLLELQRLFRGTVGHHRRRHPHPPNWSDFYYWSCSTREARRALETMLPYLRVKAELATLAIKFQSGKRPRGTSLAKCEFDEENWYAEAVKALNTSGPQREIAELPAKPENPQLKLVM